MGGLADLSLDSDALKPAAAVPTGPWGRPATLRRLEALPAIREEPSLDFKLVGPPPAPPGARPKRRRRVRTALAEALLAVAVIGALAFVFAPRTPRGGWEVQAAPVLQSLLDDVAAISQSAGHAPPSAVSALGTDLARSRRLDVPSDPVTARLWNDARLELQDAYTAMRGSGTVGTSVRADLTAGGDTLLHLTFQH